MKAPASWLYPVIDGRRYQRETNTMPQWAGSCWYYLRFIDPRNEHVLCRSGARNGPGCRSICTWAVRSTRCCICSTHGSGTRCCMTAGYVSRSRAVPAAGEPGHDPGRDGVHRVPDRGRAVGQSGPGVARRGRPSGRQAIGPVRLAKWRWRPTQVEKQGESFVLASDPAIRVDSRAYKMSKSRGNVVNPGRDRAGLRRGLRCGCTRCSWGPWRRRSPGACRESRGSAGSWIEHGA